jgi:hypothetical protein
MKPTESQFPEASDSERPEGWDYLTPEAMDEMSQHFSKDANRDK